MTITCAACGADLSEGLAICPICGSAARPSGASAGGAGTSGASDGPLPPRMPTRDLRSSEQRGWSIAAHLGGLGLGLATAAVFAFVAPLIVWLIRRDEDPYTEHHSKEALNFQLTALLAIFAFAVLLIPGIIIGILTLGIGLLVGAMVVGVAIVGWIVLPIVATVKASEGEGYRYPFTIRFVR